MAGDAPSRLPSVSCYGSGSPDHYVYDEEDNDDYKVFPPPAPGTVIESTGHGYTIVPMTYDDEGLVATAAGTEQQRKTLLAVAPANMDVSEGLVGASKDGDVAADAPGGGCVGVEADNKEALDDLLYYEFYYYAADDGLAEPETTTATNSNKTLRSARVSTGIVET